jgi:hypothetical protein
MNLEKLKQLALIEQMGGQQQPQEDRSRMALGLIQALMQQQGEAARGAEQADYRAGLLRQGQEGIDVRRDTLEQQRVMNETAAADKRTAAQTASADRQLAVIMQLAEKGDPTAMRALAGMNPAYGQARTDLTNETTATRRAGVNSALQGYYTQNATDPALLKKALSGIFANPTTTGVPGTTVEDLNAAPWEAMGAGMPGPEPSLWERWQTSRLLGGVNNAAAQGAAVGAVGEQQGPPMPGGFDPNYKGGLDWNRLGELFSKLIPVPVNDQQRQQAAQRR